MSSETGVSSAIGNGGVFASFNSRISSRQDLDFAGVELGVDGVGAAQFHGPQHGDDVLGSQSLGDGHHRRVVRHEHLRHAVAIADVEEQQAAQIAHAMDPAEEHGLRPTCGGRSAPQVCVRESVPSWSAIY